MLRNSLCPPKSQMLKVISVFLRVMVFSMKLTPARGDAPRPTRSGGKQVDDPQANRQRANTEAGRRADGGQKQLASEKEMGRHHNPPFGTLPHKPRPVLAKNSHDRMLLWEGKARASLLMSGASNIIRTRNVKRRGGDFNPRVLLRGW